MDQYTTLLDSDQYIDFILEHAEYAQVWGYNVATSQGAAKAVHDRFLFEQFLDEMVSV